MSKITELPDAEVDKAIHRISKAVGVAPLSQFGQLHNLRKFYRACLGVMVGAALNELFGPEPSKRKRKKLVSRRRLRGGVDERDFRACIGRGRS